MNTKFSASLQFWSAPARALTMAVCLASVPTIRAADTVDKKVVSFKDDLMPILSSQCAFCHVTGAENGGLNVGRKQAYAMLLGPSTEAPMPRVTPKDPEKSYLLHKLKGDQTSVGGSGNRMPMTDPPREMGADQQALFVRWIEAGAPNN